MDPPQHGGRVHLVKNVVASQRTLAEMYGDGAERFFGLKRELDPGGILRNEFLERNFGEYLAAHAPGGLRWALAGRNMVKLEAVRARLAAIAAITADRKSPRLCTSVEFVVT